MQSYENLVLYFLLDLAFYLELEFIQFNFCELSQGSSLSFAEKMIVFSIELP